VLYRYRGWVPVVPIAFALAFAHFRPAALIAGFGLMAAGESLRLWSAAHLGRTVRSARARAEKLVTTGPYAYTRHPLYLGNFALVLGFATASGAGWPWFAPAAAALFLVLYRGHARREEAALARAFPGAFAAYRAEVPGWGWRFRPARLPAAGESGAAGLRRGLRVEALTLNAEVWLTAALVARFTLFR
jgi:protein-S-isoprenylcysteine O-methyltransferase Ste14